jgi:hypothetical protein
MQQSEQWLSRGRYSTCHLNIAIRCCTLSKIELPWPISMIDVPGEGSNRVVDAKVIWAQDSSVLM